MAVTAVAVLDVARSQLGVREGPRSNENVYNTWYYGKVVYGANYPWCAVFVSWIAMRSGAADIIPKLAFTPNGVSWFKARGAWHSTPQVGDIVYYNIAGLGRVSHTGIVEQVHSDGTWTAIEGNTDVHGGRTGGQVMRQRRSTVGAGGGFGRPAYGNAPAPVTPVTSTPSSAQVSDTKRLQALVGTPVDGQWGTKSDAAFGLLIEAAYGRWHDPKAIQRALSVPADNIVGPRTKTALNVRIRQIQALIGSPADGQWGPNSQHSADVYVARLR